MKTQSDRLPHVSIWWDAFGYFAAYVPYAALARALADGSLPGGGKGVSGVTMLPATAVASVLTAVLFLFATGWFRYASQRQLGPVRLPVPTRWTFASGLSSSLIIATTTLAYTFESTSALLMVLLMRGGVLALAPVVDLLSGRKIKTVSAVALGLSLLALAVAVNPEDRRVSALALLDLGVYLGAYFIRLRTMSARAKTTDRATTLRFFVEEQLVSSPLLLVLLATGAAAGHPELRAGFAALTHAAWLPWALLIGVLSQGTGIFGGLVLLGSEENSYCVPVNRASSVLAGVVAALLLSLLTHGAGVPARELAGAGLLMVAVAALATPAVALRARPSTG